MSSAGIRTVMVGGRPEFAAQLERALGTSAVRVPPEALDRSPPSLVGEPDERGLVWIHLVPGVGDDDPLGEARLLMGSADAALDTAARGDVPVVFLAVLPSPGMFTGRAGLACELALGSMTSLMRDGIGTWSSGGRRIVGVVHAGLDGYAPPGQRPLDEIRLRTPTKTLGTFGQLADALRFVGSPRAGYVTGTLVRVDGGWDAYSWVYPARTV